MPLGYILRRVLRTCITLFIAVTVVFFAIRVLPGDPAEALMGRHISEEGLAMLRRQMGLDRSVFGQYLVYMQSLLRGDLGTSFSTGRPVAEMMIDVAPYTASVVFGALFIGTVFGIPLGVLSSVHRNRMLDYVARVVSLSGISLPGFVIAILLIVVFSVYLGWFPMTGGGSLSQPLTLIRFAFLPALAGGVGMTAYLTRLCRSAMLEALTQDYVRTARSKGLVETRVLYVHVLKNAFLPILTFIGIYAIVMVGDSIAIEIVFSRPGFGRMVLGAISQRDYNLLQSIILVYVAFAVVVNMVVDVLYSVIDPRIKRGMPGSKE